AIVKHLILQGAALNVKNQDNETPFMLAAKAGHATIMECLHQAASPIPQLPLMTTPTPQQETSSSAIPLSPASISANQIIQGNRERLPENCSPNVSELITACWAQDAIRRPTTDEVMQRLSTEQQTTASSSTPPPISPRRNAFFGNQEMPSGS